MTYLFFAVFDQPLEDEKFQALLRLLPVDHHEKILRYVMWQDRHASLFGKLLLQKGLEKFHYKSPLHLEYSQYSRPYLPDFTNLDFNISHTKKAVACVISDCRRVGIDIEEISDIKISDFKNQWTDTEYQNIFEAEDSKVAFFNYWTKKEAVLKADGRGLNIALNQIDVTGYAVLVEGKTWHLKACDLIKNHVTHLCSDIPIDEEEVVVESVIF
ncbi:4'-phosphopantetheinyl transferase family protein [Fulvivirga sediminis]|uniref:4'-phosphopantetheinyl transferase superfamily protein n=1 Tax=Fulvivirga sediminis TaxID=2803949 RepID=A0A937FBP6_9BACT|nr:4'-phosphopantetheinyl transferase superfamily protein [Fulvivirga sediminis]MBL3658717.1 4'-phosphopantetheinyl transferase superfamily protein [Fulvivirga sediminis]